jgi:hypothetical protein
MWMNAHSAVAERIVVHVMVLGAPGCALHDGCCVGVWGEPDDVIAQRLYRGAMATLTHTYAQSLFPDARIGFVLLGFNVANALLTPGRTGENGFSASAEQLRVRVVDVGGGELMKVLQLPADTPVVYTQEPAATQWAARFGSVTALVNNAHLHLAGAYRLAEYGGWLREGAPPGAVISVMERLNMMARLRTPFRVAEVLQERPARAQRAVPSRLSAALAREAGTRAALCELTSEPGLHLHVYADRRARLALAGALVAVISSRGADAEARLVPGELVVVHLDVDERLLFVERDVSADAAVVRLLDVQELGATHPLLLAAHDAGVEGDAFPPRPPAASLPRWQARGLAQGAAADAAVAAAEARDVARDLGDAARVIARGDFFSVRLVSELAAADALWEAVLVAARAARRTSAESDWVWLDSVIADASKRAGAAHRELLEAHTAELAWSDEMACFTRLSQAAGATHPLRNLPRPPLPTVTAMEAATPPPKWLMSKLGVSPQAPPYGFDSRLSLHDPRLHLPRTGLPGLVFEPPEPNGSLMRLRFNIREAFGGSAFSVDLVPTSDYVWAGIAAALPQLAAHSSRPLPVPERILRALFSNSVVDALLALPEPRDPERWQDQQSALRGAGEDSLVALYFLARGYLDAVREPDEAAAWREQLLDCAGGLRNLLSADSRGTRVPASRHSERESHSALSGTGYTCVVVDMRYNSVFYQAKLDDTMGVKSFGCRAASVQHAARIADALRVITRGDGVHGCRLNFKLHEYPAELLPRLPLALVQRGQGNDTPELAQLRIDVRSLARTVGALVSASFTDGDALSVSEREALLPHARSLALEVRAAAEAAVSAARMRAWLSAASGGGGGLPVLSAAGGASGLHAPAPPASRAAGCAISMVPSAISAPAGGGVSGGQLPAALQAVEAPRTSAAVARPAQAAAAALGGASEALPEAAPLGAGAGGAEARGHSCRS